MIKKLRENLKTTFYIFFIGIATTITIGGCGVDFLGISISNDLDSRLEEQNNFLFLDAHNWRTALDTLGTNYSFLVVNDIHISNRNSRGLDKLKSVISDNNICFMVVAGDITQTGKREDFELFIDIVVNQFGIPCYPAIGNHDIYITNWTAWKDLIGSTRYRIDAGATTLFIMDNANLYFGKSQIDWLENEIKTAAERVFVFAHAPLFGGSVVGAHDVNERARITSILRGKADAMFMGHTHGTATYEVGDVKYIINGCFYDNSLPDGHYTIVSVNGNDVKYDRRRL